MFVKKIWKERKPTSCTKRLNQLSVWDRCCREPNWQVKLFHGTGLLLKVHVRRILVSTLHKILCFVLSRISRGNELGLPPPRSECSVFQGFCHCLSLLGCLWRRKTLNISARHSCAWEWALADYSESHPSSSIACRKSCRMATQHSSVVTSFASPLPVISECPKHYGRIVE